MTQATSQGTLLKSTREARGISLEVVHEVTKIPMDALRAIEEGYTVRSLSPFYLKGFIKMYAEYLKINVQDLYVNNDKKPQAQAPIAAAVAKAPVLPEESFDLQQWLGRVFTYRRKQQIAAITILFVAFFLLFKLITFFTHRPASKPEIAKPGVKTEAVKVKKEKVAAADPVKKQPVVETATVKKAPPAMAKPAEPALPKVAEAKPPANPVKVAPSSYSSASIPQAAAPTQQLEQEIMLTVRAKKDTWLRVESDGVTVFQSGLNRGKSETWLASNKIEISGKNIQQLEFELNGKMIGALSRRDSKAKKIMITREGLAVVP